MSGLVAWAGALGRGEGWGRCWDTSGRGPDDALEGRVWERRPRTLLAVSGPPGEAVGNSMVVLPDKVKPARMVDGISLAIDWMGLATAASSAILKESWLTKPMERRFNADPKTIRNFIPARPWERFYLVSR